MCGIAGFTTFRGRPAGAGEVLRAMTAALRHRGPDAGGFHEEPGIALGHRRLSILDIEGGAQPMSVLDGRFWIASNGELFNYIELRHALEERGCAFATRSDTEVLLRHLAERGTEGLADLNGQYAFALWDRARQELLLVRDRLGIKPLYYLHEGGEVAFASELKALLRHPAARRDVDPLSVSKYLSYGYVPAPHTIFRSIRKLEPGERLRVTRDGIETSVYWDVPARGGPVGTRPVDECAEGLMALLRDAVRKQLRSDVPVGVFLSGGLDSSVITALAAAESGRRLSSFSVGFEEASYDESAYAREVARRCGTEHHHEVLSMDRAVRLLPECLATLDEPFADASILPTYLLAQSAAERVKVALSGDGGDELFAGYPAFQAHRLMERLSFLPVAWRDAFHRLARRVPVSHRYGSASFLLEQWIKGSGVSPEVRFFLWLGCMDHRQKQQVLAPEVREALVGADPFEDILRHVRRGGVDRGLERLLYLCIRLYLQDDILWKVDRASMAHALEVRPPFLDHRVVEYMAGVETQYKLKGLTTKYLLKRAARDLLPARIIRRRKAGFMMPVAAWLAKDLRPMVEEHCAPDVLDGLFDPAGVRKLLDEHFQRRRDHRKAIWALFCYQVWRRRYAG